MNRYDPLLEAVTWNDQGLVPAIAQDWESGEVLMLAWMNREALACTLAEQRAVYWSRSRNALWHKGEQSGNVQRLKQIKLDCDKDTVLMLVEQVGGIACHTGRRHCFFYALSDDASTNAQWQATEPVIKDPADIYGKK